MALRYIRGGGGCGRQAGPCVRPEESGAEVRLAGYIRDALDALHRRDQPVTVVCVGTDRSSGDALGPLVGTFLKEVGPCPFYLLGTLDQPVHAGNLTEFWGEIQAASRQGPVVALDAVLGHVDCIGAVRVRPGPLAPAEGVRKKPLPHFGDVAVLGAINVGGFHAHAYDLVQHTRLGLVYPMAQLIRSALLIALME